MDRSEPVIVVANILAFMMVVGGLYGFRLLVRDLIRAAKLRRVPKRPDNLEDR